MQHPRHPAAQPSAAAMETPWSFAKSSIDGHTWTSDHAADLNGTNLDSVLQSLNSDRDLGDDDEVEALPVVVPVLLQQNVRMVRALRSPTFFQGLGGKVGEHLVLNLWMTISSVCRARRSDSQR